MRRTTLRGVSDIRSFFRTNETPIYFVSATAFNLLGIDRWVRNFRFVNYYDSFDGTHPNVFVPKEQTPRAFTSIEEIVNYLLGHKEVGDLVTANGGAGKAAFLMFD
jgi:type IV secretory pathway TraG/TraD family ATPase VirD4